MIKVLLLANLAFLTLNPAFGLETQDKGEDHFGDRTFSDKIKTVMLRSSSWELSAPVYDLGSDQKLELLFDDLSGTRHSYSYTFVHCDVAWNRSDLQPQEFLSGIGQGDIRESASSVNTTFDFIHYRLEFPVEDCMPVISGNYALIVFEGDDPEHVVLTRRFYVIEKIVQLTGRVKQAPAGDFRETGQQVEFNLNYGNLPVRDPLRELAVIIRQNGRDDRILTNPRPSAVASGRIDFTGPEEGIFPGGNEFRSLDIKSMKYQTENIASIDFKNPYYHVFLKPDKSRENKLYFSKSDLNGNFFINEEKAREKHLEADYVYVHFCLEQNYPLEDDVFVFGRFTDWALGKSNKMEYNAVKKCYESTLLLKQGLYDYAYATLDKTTGKANDELFEGSFYETGNDYEIYIYLHDSRGRYDRIIGYLPLKI